MKFGLRVVTGWSTRIGFINTCGNATMDTGYGAEGARASEGVVYVLYMNHGCLTCKYCDEIYTNIHIDSFSILSLSSPASQVKSLRNYGYYYPNLASIKIIECAMKKTPFIFV